MLASRRAPHRRRDPPFDRVLPHDRSRRPPRRDDRDGRPRHRDRGPRILLRDRSWACRSSRAAWARSRSSPGVARRRRRRRADRRHRPRAGRGAEVRPINLIPVEQRRGAARGPGARHQRRRLRAAGRPRRRRGVRARRSCCPRTRINEQDREARRRRRRRRRAQKQVADALRPYGQFADMQRARHQQISRAHHRPLRLGARAASSCRSRSRATSIC